MIRPLLLAAGTIVVANVARHTADGVAIAVVLVVYAILKRRHDRRRQRRDRARDNVLATISKVLGAEVRPKKVGQDRRTHRVTSVWATYSAGANDGPDAENNLTFALKGRMGGRPIVKLEREQYGVIKVSLRRPHKFEDHDRQIATVEHIVENQIGPRAYVTGVGWNGKTVTKFTVRYPPTTVDTVDTFRAKTDQIIETKLGRKYTSDWQPQNHQVVYHQAQTLPINAPHPVGKRYPANIIPFGVGPNDKLAVWDLAFAPHCIVVGQTGAGKSTTVFSLITELAAQGIPVHACDPKMIGLLGLRDWPGVKLTTNMDGIIGEILSMEAEMTRRLQAVHDGQIRESELAHIVLFIDEMWDAYQQIDEMWAGRTDKDKDDPKKAPARLALSNILRKGRQVGVHVGVALQRPDAKIFDGGEARNNFGAKIVCGSPDAETGRMLGITTKLESPGKGRAIVDTGFGEQEVQVWNTPNPADYPDLSVANKHVLDGLRAAAQAAFVGNPVAPETPADEDSRPGLRLVHGNPKAPSVMAPVEPAAPVCSRCEQEGELAKNRSWCRKCEVKRVGAYKRRQPVH